MLYFSVVFCWSFSKIKWYFNFSLCWNFSENSFCCFEGFFILLSSSVFQLLAVFQSVPLAFMLSYFRSSFLCFILPFQKNDQVKASSNSTPAPKAKVSAKPQHQKEGFSREMLVFLFIWQVCLLCVQASNPRNF